MLLWVLEAQCRRVTSAPQPRSQGLCGAPHLEVRAAERWGAGSGGRARGGGGGGSRLCLTSSYLAIPAINAGLTLQ